MIAVLIAIESTRGTLISATLAVGEKSCRRAFSSARASRLHSQLLLWNVSTTNASEYFVAISEVSGVPCSPPRAHGGLPARMRQSRPTLKKINPDLTELYLLPKFLPLTCPPPPSGSVGVLASVPVALVLKRAGYTHLERFYHRTYHVIRALCICNHFLL